MRKKYFNNNGISKWLLFSCTVIFIGSHINATILNGLKYDRNTNVFYALLNSNSNTCDGRGSDISSLSIIGFTDTIKYSSFAGIFQYFPYQLNNIADTNFINAQQLNKP